MFSVSIATNHPPIERATHKTSPISNPIRIKCHPKSTLHLLMNINNHLGAYTVKSYQDKNRQKSYSSSARELAKHSP